METLYALIWIVALLYVFYLCSSYVKRARKRVAGRPRRDPRPHSSDVGSRPILPQIRGRAGRHSRRYTAHMHSPEWALMREHVLRRAGYRCEFCKAPGPLEVHHLTYRHLGHERPYELRALCRSCHAEADRLRRQHRGH